MIKNVFLAAALVAALIVRVPTVGTFTYYKATGAFAQTKSPCGPPRSFFNIPLQGAPSERIEISINHGAASTAPLSVSVSAVSRAGNVVRLDPRNITLEYGGKNVKASAIEISDVRGFGKLTIRGFSADFAATGTPSAVILRLGSGTVQVNGANFPPPAMRFNWVSETKAYAQSINC